MELQKNWYCRKKNRSSFAMYPCYSCPFLICISHTALGLLKYKYNDPLSPVVHMLYTTTSHNKETTTNASKLMHLSYTISTNSSTTCMIRGFLDLTQDSSQLTTTACMHMSQTPAHDNDHAPHAWRHDTCAVMSTNFKCVQTLNQIRQY